MKLASRINGHPDGELLIVSRDLQTAIAAADIASSMRDAVERWDEVGNMLQERYTQLNAGKISDAVSTTSIEFDAPLPRAWQWLDGSAFPSHGELMQRAFDLKPIESSAPLMYQGMSHQFLAPRADVPFPDEADDIDFEGEFGVITGPVPCGISAAQALQCVLLIVQINDWSLRRLAPIEMKTGFGWIQAKPACSMAPIAVTPDELGTLWQDGRISAELEVRRNGARFGRVPAAEMAYGFHDLIAHAAATRSLCAGTIIGSGTVSSPSFRDVGSCCIAERRAIEMIDGGRPQTAYLKFGERIEMQAYGTADESLFGRIDQQVVRAG